MIAAAVKPKLDIGPTEHKPGLDIVFVTPKNCFWMGSKRQRITFFAVSTHVPTVADRHDS